MGAIAEGPSVAKATGAGGGPATIGGRPGLGITVARRPSAPTIGARASTGSVAGVRGNGRSSEAAARAAGQAPRGPIPPLLAIACSPASTRFIEAARRASAVVVAQGDSTPVTAPAAGKKAPRVALPGPPCAGCASSAYVSRAYAGTKEEVGPSGPRSPDKKAIVARPTFAPPTAYFLGECTPLARWPPRAME